MKIFVKKKNKRGKTENFVTHVVFLSFTLVFFCKVLLPSIVHFFYSQPPPPTPGVLFSKYFRVFDIFVVMRVCRSVS